MNKPSQEDRAPKFDSEAEERKFWATHDTTPYVDWNRAVPASFPNLKTSTGRAPESYHQGRRPRPEDAPE